MKTRSFVPIAVFLLCVSGVALADRELEKKEVLQIFQKLTEQSRKTWIAAGTIEARREEYRAPETTDLNKINRGIKEKIAKYQSRIDKRELTENLQKMKLDAIPFNTRYELSNEYTMNSTITVRFDGDRFYWEINVDSRTDSVRPSKDLEGNFMTEQFNLDWNTRRIFAWDGENYTTYFLPGNHAIVDSTGETPHVVNGPLTAGIIPWGYGFYTYDNLAAMDSMAIEKYADGQPQIRLTLNNSDGSEMLFVMDPQKDYAVKSCLITGHGDVVISKDYCNYQSIGGNWVPFTILLERYEAESSKLLARDLWNITSIDENVPEADSFDVSYENNALIEYFSFVADESSMYQYSESADTEQLLADRLAYVTEDSQPRNCATAALKYAIGRLGKNITDRELARLVSEPDKTTNLYQMKQFVQGLGFYCRAVKTDIDTLRGLEDCEIILHIPGRNHFIVVSDIDDEYIRVIDLAANKFYYRTDLDFFSMDWTEGTALIMSNNIIEGKYAEIGERELGNITGASGYQCNVLRQEYNVIYCTYVGGQCEGFYREFYTRWGCGVAESGSCSQSKMVRYKKSPCIEDPYDPLACDVTGEWTVYYMMACN